MTTFLFSYRMPKDVPGRSDVMDRWTSWFEGMGGDLVDTGNPTLPSEVLGDAGPDSALGGYSIVRAADLDAAIALAEGCPALTEGGGVEVGVITRLDGRGKEQGDG